MSKPVKWVVWVLGGALGVVTLAAVVLYARGGARLNRAYDIPVAAIAIPTDEAAVTRGRHLAEAVTLCSGCHGADLGGDVLVDEPAIATIYASNLTSGAGGVGATYSDADYLRAIRHGVNAEGRGLMIMHSDAYHNLGTEDLAAIIAYIRSVAPVDKAIPRTRPAAVGRIMVALGLFDNDAMPLIPAEVIDHTAPVPERPPPGVTPEYGGYLVSIALCRMCHGPDLAGGPPIDQGAPPGPNIAVYGLPGGWSEEQFVTTIRTGVTPSGRMLDKEFMPWEVYGKMTDEELRAIRLYLTSLGDSTATAGV